MTTKFCEFEFRIEEATNGTIVRVNYSKQMTAIYGYENSYCTTYIAREGDDLAQTIAAAMVSAKLEWENMRAARDAALAQTVGGIGGSIGLSSYVAQKAEVVRTPQGDRHVVAGDVVFGYAGGTGSTK